MRKRFVVAVFAISFISLLGFSAKNVSATDAAGPNVVISQVQVRDAINASNEIVEIYNNSPNEIDITNWCLFYASKDYLTPPASDWRKLTCFVPEAVDTEIALGGQSYARIISKVYTPPYTGNYLALFTATLGNDAGHVKLVDSLGNEVDRVGWGVGADNPEGLPAVIGTSSVIERKYDIERDVLIDTNNNATDFFDTSLDLCRNMVGLQDIVPLGYLSNTNRNCSLAPDICNNIDGPQVVMPDGYESDGAGGCISLDICPNIDGIQYVPPKNYILKDDGSCINDLLPLKITELLPNPVGNDAGSEFIEIYNPDNRSVDLTDYKLSIGLSDEKLLDFPEGSKIGPLAFESFSNADLVFTLVNTSIQVKLLSSGGKVVDATTDAYIDPLPGMSWALINSTWQYTDRVTPGAENLEKSAETIDSSQALESEAAGSASILKPCAPNQYRNPETNRCRSIASDSTTVLTPCKAGQYRSEETNRCRSLVSDVASLMPCSEDQERNPDTNRCRSVLGASSTLVPCAEGQERNPETNRCRNIVSSIPEAGFAIDPVPAASDDVTGWWAFGGVGLLALGYAGWEWRVEATRLLGRVGTFFHSAK